MIRARIGVHPLHVVLIHFPVALWPAHWVFHCVARWLPAGVPGVAGFWLLALGSAIGWLAAICGLPDWMQIMTENDARRMRHANMHALINGSALLGFTTLAALEVPHYPQIAHGPKYLAAEAVLLAWLFVGNYFGGAVVWDRPSLASGDQRAE